MAIEFLKFRRFFAHYDLWMQKVRPPLLYHQFLVFSCPCGGNYNWVLYKQVEFVIFLNLLPTKISA